jgi:tetratricopeptide (TPR) repeat protein
LANLVRQLGEHRVACALHASVRETLLGEGRVGTARFRRAEENLAGCITLLGHYDEARTIYLELLARRPNDARVNMELGYAWLHVFAFDETEAAMERALALEPALPSPRKVLSDLPRLRSEHLALAAPERRRLAPMKWASLLTSVGRLPDAERAWLEIIEDPRSSRRAASDAVDFLLANGSFSNAEHGFAMYRAKVDASEDLPVEREALDKRRRQQARLDAVRPRLEALVGHTPFDER